MIMVRVWVKDKFAEEYRDHITQDTILRANQLDIVLNIAGNTDALHKSIKRDHCTERQDQSEETRCEDIDLIQIKR